MASDVASSAGEALLNLLASQPYTKSQLRKTPTRHVRSHSDQIRPYRYPWTVDNKTIRLITICPARAAQSPVLEILVLTFPLTDLPCYNSLSYTWGPPEAGAKDYTANDRIPILVNGLRFFVLPNLYNALLQLRDACPQEYFWIDAICINQADLAERASQVSIMDQIFRKASKVVIWLGKAKGGIRHLVGLLDQLQQLPAATYRDIKATISQGALSGAPAGDPLMESDLCVYGIPLLSSAIWDLAAHFFQRRWFSRLWIIQEIVLAREAVVLCDRRMIPWTALLRCDEILQERRLWSAVYQKTANSLPTDPGRQFQTGDGFDQVPLEYPHEKTLEVITTTKAWCQVEQSLPWPRFRGSTMSIDYSKLLLSVLESDVRSLTGCQKLSAPAILFYFMWQNKDMVTTDDRDKVYAFLGIVNAICAAKNIARLDIAPDYSPNTTLASLLQWVTVRVLRESRQLTLLAAGPPASRRVLYDLPSWVPDFSSSGGNLGEQLQQPACKQEILAIKPQFTASWRPDYWPSGRLFSVAGPKLRVHALGLGRIKRICDLDVGLAGPWADWPKWSAAGHLLAEVDDPYPLTGERRVFALWRTLVLDAEMGRRPAAEALGTSFAHVVYEAAYRECDAVRRRGDRALDQFLASLKGFAFLADFAEEERFVREGVVAARRADAGRPESWGRCDGGTPLGLGRLLAEAGRQGARFKGELGRVFSHRRLFLTDSGLLGVGQAGAREGDTVCVVAGAPTPVVLRHGRAGTGRGSRVVSVGYVHGLMDGEPVGLALQAGARWEGVVLE